MNKQHVGWTVAAIVVAVAFATGAAAPESQVGRFQVIAAERTLVDKKGEPSVWKETLLLDTATGKTWNASSVAGKSYFWLPFDPLPARQ